MTHGISGHLVDRWIEASEIHVAHFLRGPDLVVEPCRVGPAPEKAISGVQTLRDRFHQGRWVGIKLVVPDDHELVPLLPEEALLDFRFPVEDFRSLVCLGQGHVSLRVADHTAVKQTAIKFVTDTCPTGDFAEAIHLVTAVRDLVFSLRR